MLNSRTTTTALKAAGNQLRRRLCTQHHHGSNKNTSTVKWRGGDIIACCNYHETAFRPVRTRNTITKTKNNKIQKKYKRDNIKRQIKIKKIKCAVLRKCILFTRKYDERAWKYLKDRRLWNIKKVVDCDGEYVCTIHI